MTTPLQRAFRFHNAATTVRPTRQNVVIEAGAGTGKTSAIVAEVLGLLLEDEDLAPERIVLMTFTEKAAGEIADRIHHALAEIELQLESGGAAWPSGSPKPLFVVEPAQRDAYQRACRKQLARVDSIRSQTIHSFCQSLLRTYPIEAGLDPQFKIIEGFERSLLYSRLYDEWVDEETRTNPTPAALREWEFLLAHFGYLFQIRKQIFELLSRRDLLTEPSIDLGDIDLVQADIASAISTIRRSDTSNVTDEAAAQIFRYVKETPAPAMTIEALIDYFAPIARAIREANLPGTRDLKEALVIFRTDRSKGLSIHERLVRHRSSIALYSLTRRFIDFLDREKRTLGVADFDDLLLRTLALLGNADVLARVRNQFDYIFVDEFQDTDRTQARIIEKLGTDSSGQWVAGKTIVVGDPKQSIYGFRRADPETYRSMTNALVSAGADHRVLRDQYRSDAPLVDSINTMFTKLFGSGDSNANVFRPAYHTLNSAKGGGAPAAQETRITFLHSRHDDASERHIVEAEAIAAYIEQHRDGSEKDLQRFAILLRRLTRIDDYLDVFDRHGIDYVLPSTKAFLERRAPVDLLAVLRAIAFPFDRGAEASAARTPYFALTDDEMTEGMLGEGDSPAWIAYQQALNELRERARHLTVAGTIDLVVAGAQIEKVYASLTDAHRAQRHLERVRAIAFEYDTKLGGSLRDFVEEIDRRREDPDEVEPSLADDDSNAVRILSVHAAKGLEFETVILPDLVFKTRNGGDNAEIYDVEEPRCLVMTGRAQSLSAHYRFTPAGSRLKTVAGEREEAEGRRLFYVAVTRAMRDVVFVCNTAAYRNDGFVACLQSIFGFEKDSFDSMWDREHHEIGGIKVRFGGRQAILPVATGKIACPPLHLKDAELQRQLAEGPIVDAQIAPPPPAPRFSTQEAAIVRAGAKNRASGILLHRVLELWDGTSDVEALIDALGAEAAADADAIARVRQRLSMMRRSTSFQRIAQATTVARELPIRFVDEERGEIVERRIDRLIVENGREVVVDYKSGAASPERLAGDREQVARYCAAVESMTGRPCTGLLWYVDAESDELIAVP